MNLIIETNEGNKFTAIVESYDPASVNEMLNDRDVVTVNFGDIVVSRISVKAVYPADQAV